MYRSIRPNYLSIVFVMVVLSASSVLSSNRDIIKYFRTMTATCQPMEKLTVGQPTQFLLIYEPGEKFAKDIKVVDVTVKIEGGLQYDGPLSWHYDFSVQPVDSIFFNMTIPKNDTSVIIFNYAFGKDGLGGLARTFVSTDDTVAFYHGDITKSPGFRKPVQKHAGRTMPPPTDLDGNPIDRPMTRDEWLFQQMKFRERSPLTDADAQHMLIDGKLYMRSRGETKFRPYDSTEVQTEIYGGEFDTTNLQHLLVLDLSDAAMRDSVESMVDTLYPTDQIDIFKVIVEEKILRRIQELGIPIKNRARVPLLIPIPRESDTDSNRGSARAN